MMDEFIDDIKTSGTIGKDYIVEGRISSLRNHGNVSFLDVVDGSGKIQVVVEKKNVSHFKNISKTPIGSYVSAHGSLKDNGRGPEIAARSIDIVSEASLPLSPTPWEIDGTDPAYGNQVFGWPSFYVSNPERAAVLKFKSSFTSNLHKYFQENRFVLVDPPILTDKTLYDEDTAIRAKVHGEDVYLTQCATFELEPLAMMFGKVYTISPAFRNENGGSKRHLAEYTHAKAEVMRANMEDLMFLAGDSLHSALSNTVSDCPEEIELLGADIDIDGLHPKNHEIMAYDEALEIIRSNGSHTEYGSGLKSSDEKILTSHVGNKYIWVQFPPFESEGFPYRRNPKNPKLSMVADLIAPHGAGEIVGIAEKTTDAEELIENIIAKGKQDHISSYWEYILLRKYGLPEHGGMGAAPERIVYGLLGLDHVRLTRPYPRYPDRKILTNNRDMNPWNDPDVARLIRKYNITQD